MDDTLAIDSNSNLSPWRERDVSQDSTEMYNNTIDAGTKGKFYF